MGVTHTDTDTDTLPEETASFILHVYLIYVRFLCNVTMGGCNNFSASLPKAGMGDDLPWGDLCTEWGN